MLSSTTSSSSSSRLALSVLRIQRQRERHKLLTTASSSASLTWAFSQQPSQTGQPLATSFLPSSSRPGYRSLSNHHRSQQRECHYPFGLVGTAGRPLFMSFSSVLLDGCWEHVVPQHQYQYHRQQSHWFSSQAAPPDSLVGTAVGGADRNPNDKTLTKDSDDNDNPKQSTNTNKKSKKKKKSQPQQPTLLHTNNNKNNKKLKKSPRRKATTMPRIKLLHLQSSIQDRIIVEKWVDQVLLPQDGVDVDIDLQSFQKWIHQIDTKLNLLAASLPGTTTTTTKTRMTKKQLAEEELEKDGASKKSTKQKKKRTDANTSPLLQKCRSLVSSSHVPLVKRKSNSTTTTTLSSSPTKMVRTKPMPAPVRKGFWDLLIVPPPPSKRSNSNKDKQSTPNVHSTDKEKQLRHVHILQAMRNASIQEPFVWNHRGAAKRHKKKKKSTGNSTTTDLKTPVPWSTLLVSDDSDVDMSNIKEEEEDMVVTVENDGDDEEKKNNQEYEKAWVVLQRLSECLPPQHCAHLFDYMEELYGNNNQTDTEGEEKEEGNDSKGEQKKKTKNRLSLYSQLDQAIPQSHYVHKVALELAQWVHLKLAPSPEQHAEKVEEEEEVQNMMAEDELSLPSEVGVPLLSSEQQRKYNQLDMVAMDPNIISSYQAWQTSKTAIVDSFLSIQSKLLQEEEEQKNAQLLRIESLKRSTPQTSKNKDEILTDDESITSTDSSLDDDDDDESSVGELSSTEEDDDDDEVLEDDADDVENQAQMILNEERALSIAANMKRISKSQKRIRCVFDAIFMGGEQQQNISSIYSGSSSTPLTSIPSTTMQQQQSDHHYHQEFEILGGSLPVTPPCTDRVVIVDNLPIDITKEKLMDSYSRCGSIQSMEIFNVRPELDPGRHRSDSIKKIRKPYSTGQHRKPWARSRTPVYAMIVFENENGYEKAISDPLRIFGMVVDRHLIRSHPGREMTKLYLENASLAKYSVKDIEYHLTQWLHPELYVCLEDQFHGGGERLGPKPSMAGTITCEINFPTFEATYWAYVQLCTQWDGLQQIELDSVVLGGAGDLDADDDTTTSTTSSSVGILKPALHWMETPTDALLYWTRELNF